MDHDVHTDVVSVSYRPDDASSGELEVRARFEDFEGRARAWTDRLTCAVFAERLSEYPLRDAATFSGGLGAPPEYLEFIGLSVAPRGGKGQVVARLHLASHGWFDGKPFIVHEATIDFPTSYEYLRRFSKDLHVALDHGGVATLLPDVLR